MVNNETKNWGFAEEERFIGFMPELAKEVGKVVGVNDNQPVVSTFDCVNNGVQQMETISVYDVMIETEDVPAGVATVEELKEAIAQGGDVALGETMILDSALVFNNSVDVKLNLNGETIENASVVDGFSTGLQVENGVLTIEGEGTVKTTATSPDDYSMAVWARGGDVKIYGGTFMNEGDSTDLIYANGGGNVYIYGGVFIPAGPASGEANGTKNPYTALNVKDSDYKSGKSNIFVYGGKFYNFDPSNNVSEGPNTNFVVEGYKVVESVEGTDKVYTVIPE